MTKEGGLLFLFSDRADRAYGFDVKVKHYKFCEDYNSLGLLYLSKKLIRLEFLGIRDFGLRKL